jgi:hypothetical protein
MIAGRFGRVRAIAWWLLAFGIVLRIVTWILLRPVNRDFHIGVILRMAATGRLPLSNETDQTNHPQLYYLLSTTVRPPQEYSSSTPHKTAPGITGRIEIPSHQIQTLPRDPV